MEENLLKKLRDSYFIKIGLIPFLLLFLWFILTFLQVIINDESLTVIKTNYYKNDFPPIATEPLLKGVKRNFEITASQDNLGIIGIAFNTYERFNHDDIIFRIKQKNAKNWYYEEKHNTRAFSSLPFYPFGFPLIHDSKGKQYVIQIESINGNELSSVAIDTKGKIISSSYQFEKQRLFKDRRYLIQFLYNKTINSLENDFLFFASSVFIYPLIFYMFWLLIENKIQSKSIVHNPLVALIGIAVIINILFVEKSFDLVYVTIGVLWSVVLIFIQKSSKSAYFSAILLLIGCLCTQLLSQTQISEKFAVWAFFSGIVGIFLDIYVFKAFTDSK